MRRHILVEENPNDVSGGGGCLCHIRKTADTTGPYTTFPATEMDDVMSPYVVICAPCLREAHANLEGQPLAGGETSDVYEAEVVEEVPEI